MEVRRTSAQRGDKRREHRQERRLKTRGSRRTGARAQGAAAAARPRDAQSAHSLPLSRYPGFGDRDMCPRGDHQPQRMRVPASLLLSWRCACLVPGCSSGELSTLSSQSGGRTSIVHAWPAESLASATPRFRITRRLGCGTYVGVMPTGGEPRGVFEITRSTETQSMKAKSRSSRPRAIREVGDPTPASAPRRSATRRSEIRCSI